MAGGRGCCRRPALPAALPAALGLCLSLCLLLPLPAAAWSPALLPPAARSNWCSYTVTRTVSCHVQNGTFLQRVFQGCRWPLACSGGSYRAVVRPLYRVAYRTLTALEWRCCPGHTGANCEEEAPTFLTLRDTGRPSSAPRRPLLHPTAFSGCLNCSRIGELTARLATLEAQVARLAVAEPPTPAAPKGSTPGRGPEAGQLWGSPAARGSPGDDGTPGWRGPPGSKGDAGGRGPSGIPGVKGPVGPPASPVVGVWPCPPVLTGSVPPQGPQGHPGSRGQDGAQGEPGPRGEPGDRGTWASSFQTLLRQQARLEVLARRVTLLEAIIWPEPESGSGSGARDTATPGLPRGKRGSGQPPYRIVTPPRRAPPEP
ncbi:EMI domain-containing protein 1 [Corvus kubaryi]|uniref:EMI domain-containing protein 1 n=1 Tax=Corvus kubaryi TaxID=68294 RepID=UPI001C03BD26|nr:EMI domain-containing protein 1 [Corvus kubaryi]